MALCTNTTTNSTAVLNKKKQRPQVQRATALLRWYRQTEERHLRVLHGSS